MGDRCFLRLYFFTKDGEIIERECGVRASEIVSCGATACLELEGANYALYTELNECARLGLTFQGWHGAGGDYQGHRFVAKDGTYLE